MPIFILQQLFTGLRIDKKGRPYATLNLFAQSVGVLCFVFSIASLSVFAYYDGYWRARGRNIADLTTWLVLCGMLLLLCLIGAGLLRWRCWVENGALFYRKGLLPTKQCPVDELRNAARQRPIQVSKAMGHYVLPAQKGKIKLHYLFSHGLVALMDYVYKGRESRQPYNQYEQRDFQLDPSQWMARDY